MKAIIAQKMTTGGNDGGEIGRIQQEKDSIITEQEEPSQQQPTDGAKVDNNRIPATPQGLMIHDLEQADEKATPSATNKMKDTKDWDGEGNKVVMSTMILSPRSIWRNSWTTSRT